jgi:hypothetical protein
MSGTSEEIKIIRISRWATISPGHDPVQRYNLYEALSRPGCCRNWIRLVQTPITGAIDLVGLVELNRRARSALHIGEIPVLDRGHSPSTYAGARSMW